MSSYFKFINQRDEDRSKLFCIVEGPSDEKFYNLTLYKKLNYKKEKLSFISNGTNGGKEKVVKLYKLIKSKTYSDLSRCIFIVDKDYDGLDGNDINLTDLEKSHITVLPCYSFENYYLYQTNLNIVFKYSFHKKNKKLSYEFEKEFNSFLDNIKKFCAIKKTLQENNLKTSVSLGDDAEKLINNKEFNALNKRVEKAEKKIKKEYNTIYNDYINNVGLLKKKPHLIKGKILFDFLLQFILKNAEGSNYSKKNLIDLAKYFDIAIEVKFIDVAP